MTFDRIITLVSTLTLVYFAYGTWRIDRTLGRVDKNIQSIRDMLGEYLDHK